MRILIVEDSDILRDRLVESFSDIDSVEVVGWAADAQSALRLIRELNPDLITLDIRLLQSNGFQVLLGLRTQSHKPKVMVLTNFLEPHYREKFLENGASYFFDKSNEFDAALGELRRLSHQMASDGCV